MWQVVFLALLLWQAPGSDPAAEGLKALEEQRWDAAIASFSKVVAADSQNYAAWFNLAFAQGMSGHASDAVASYRKALALKPRRLTEQIKLVCVVTHCGWPPAAPRQ